MPDEPVVTEPTEPTEPVEPVEPAEPQVIPRDVLPEELRNQSDENVKMYLDAMRQGLTTRQAENDQLRQELAYARTAAVPAHAVPDIEPVEELSKEDLQQLILDDPMKALDWYAEKKFGPQFRGVESVAGEGAYAAASRRWSDFDEMEPTVRELIGRSGQMPSPALIETAYVQAQGMVRVQEKKDALAKASVATKPSPPGPTDKTPSLTKLQEEIAAASGMTKEEMIQFKDADEMTMEVPLG